VKLTIDGQSIETREGRTVLEAAREHGIHVPALCFHPRLGKAGAAAPASSRSRVYAGSRSRARRPVRDGMVVRTDTPRVLEVRRMVVELLLSEGHHQCNLLPGSGECELQEMAYMLGIERPGLLFDSRPAARHLLGGIVREADKCIQCGRCVTGLPGPGVNQVLAFGYRGHSAGSSPTRDRPLGESSCVLCGECVQVCPGGGR